MSRRLPSNCHTCAHGGGATCALVLDGALDVGAQAARAWRSGAAGGQTGSLSASADGCPAHQHARMLDRWTPFFPAIGQWRVTGLLFGATDAPDGRDVRTTGPVEDALAARGRVVTRSGSDASGITTWVLGAPDLAAWRFLENRTHPLAGPMFALVTGGYLHAAAYHRALGAASARRAA